MPVKYTHFVIAERGHQKNAAKPPRPAQTGWLVPKQIVLEFERTTPSAPFKGTGIFLDGAATPPLPRRGVFASCRFILKSSTSGSLTLGRLFESITSASPMMPLRFRM